MSENREENTQANQELQRNKPSQEVNRVCLTAIGLALVQCFIATYLTLLKKKFTELKLGLKRCQDKAASKWTKTATRKRRPATAQPGEDRGKKDIKATHTKGKGHNQDARF